MNEFDRIRKGLALLPGIRAAGVIVGPGDDAAVVNPHESDVSISTDAMVEGIHFSTDWSSAQDIGSKLIHSSVSDLAAMGATLGYNSCLSRFQRRQAPIGSRGSGKEWEKHAEKHPLLSLVGIRQSRPVRSFCRPLSWGVIRRENHYREIRPKLGMLSMSRDGWETAQQASDVFNREWSSKLYWRGIDDQKRELSGVNVSERRLT